MVLKVEQNPIDSALYGAECLNLENTILQPEVPGVPYVFFHFEQGGECSAVKGYASSEAIISQLDQIKTQNYTEGYFWGVGVGISVTILSILLFRTFKNLTKSIDKKIFQTEQESNSSSLQQ